MFGNEKKDKQILNLYGEMPLKEIAKKTKSSLYHVSYVLYKKQKKK
ncbi:MAG: hypothetical protein QXH07_01185 [Thermoplasmata archaeon]